MQISQPCKDVPLLVVFTQGQFLQCRSSSIHRSYHVSSQGAQIIEGDSSYHGQYQKGLIHWYTLHLGLNDINAISSPTSHDILLFMLAGQVVLLRLM